MREDETRYSEAIKGDRGNYKWPVRFDINGRGYLGISQMNERVLMCPAQVAELVAFIKAKPR